METKSFVKQSMWLMPDDVPKEGCQVIILDEGETYPSQYGPIHRVRIEYPVGTIRWLKTQQKSLKELHAVWGTESKNWVGKRVLLTVEKVKEHEIIVMTPLVTLAQKLPLNATEALRSL